MTLFGVVLSSIVNEIIKTVSSVLFFYEKILSIKKHESAKQTIFTFLEVFAHVKNCSLCCLVFDYFCFVSWFLLVTCFCAFKIFSLKKKIIIINRFESALITFTILLTCNPNNPPIENLFVRTYVYLWSSARISSFMRIIFFCENLFKFTAKFTAKKSFSTNPLISG